jgi:hypothetical protein
MSQTLARNTGGEFEDLVDECILHSSSHRHGPPHWSTYSHEIKGDTPNEIVSAAEPRMGTPQEPSYDKLRPYFGWISPDAIKKTFQLTTQLARTTTGTLLKRMYRAQNPALNVIRRNESVATDDLFSDTPAVDCGATSCQVFVGMCTDVVDIYPLQSSKQFANTLEDNIRFRGAPTKLLSDRSQIEISGKALEILRVSAISS